MNSRSEHARAEAFCRSILPDVSRTFAMSIQWLPGELGRSVLAGYLLCRIADTVEDDRRLPPEAKLAALERFQRSLDDPSATDDFFHAARAVQGDPRHVELVRHTSEVLAVYRARSEADRRILQKWVAEMVSGMRSFITKYPGGIRIRTLEEHSNYCYYVAGTVGHLLTDLWREHAHGIDDARYAALVDECEAFGRALQAVNILKDIADDVENQNAIYVPHELLAKFGSGHDTILDEAHRPKNRAAVAVLIERAHEDIDRAIRYWQLLPKRAPFIRMFCGLPLLLASATLRELSNSEAMLERGGKVKITRQEVRALVACSAGTLASNRMFGSIERRTRRSPVGLGLRAWL
jgi:farnesyl-diphosphate farnesyltransferase